MFKWTDNYPLSTKSNNTTKILPADIQHAKEEYVVPYFCVCMTCVSYECSTGYHEENKKERKKEEKKESKKDGMFS